MKCWKIGQEQELQGRAQMRFGYYKGKFVYLVNQLDVSLFFKKSINFIMWTILNKLIIISYKQYIKLVYL